MKKTLATILTLAICITLSACASGGSNEDVLGTYNNITFLEDASFTLNENATYDRTIPNEKGTYKTSKNGFTLTNTNDDDTVFAKKDNYYYRTNLICCFEKDEDYGLAPTFNDNGVSNQWFSAYYDSISDNKWNVVILELKDDNTFKFRDCIRDSSGNQYDETIYQGTYSLDNYVLNLKCENGHTIPLLFIDGKIYFDIYVKQ